MAMALLIFTGALAGANTVSGYDLWWQLKTGEIIWTTRTIPHTDLYSHTAAGRPWVVHEWLAEVLFYLLYRWSPLTLVIWKIFMAISIFGGALWVGMRLSGHLWAPLALTALAAYAASPFFDIRPQLFTYLGAVATLGILLHPGIRHLWLLPALVALWANLHAGFNVGVLFVFSWAFWETMEGLFGRSRERGRLRTLWGVALTSLIAGLLNPNGYLVYAYPFHLMSHKTVMNFIVEWFSPNFHEASTRPYEMLIALIVLGLALSRRPKPPASLWLLVFFLHASLMFWRNLPLFCIVTAILLAPHLADILDRLRNHPAVCRWPGRAAPLLTATFLVGGAISQVKAIPKGNLFDVSVRRSTFPEAACRFLDEHHLPGPMYNEYKWGGYLIWRFYPGRKVFMDGRAEVYFGPAFDAYYSAHNAHANWQQALDRYRVDLALVEAGSALSKAMTASSHWQEVYRDPQSVIYIRKAEDKVALQEKRGTIPKEGNRAGWPDGRPPTPVEGEEQHGQH